MSHSAKRSGSNSSKATPPAHAAKRLSQIEAMRKSMKKNDAAKESPAKDCIQVSVDDMKPEPSSPKVHSKPPRPSSFTTNGMHRFNLSPLSNTVQTAIELSSDEEEPVPKPPSRPRHPGPSQSSDNVNKENARPAKQSPFTPTAEMRQAKSDPKLLVRKRTRDDVSPPTNVANKRVSGQYVGQHRQMIGGSPSKKKTPSSKSPEHPVDDDDDKLPTLSDKSTPTSDELQQSRRKAEQARLKAEDEKNELLKRAKREARKDVVDEIPGLQEKIKESGQRIQAQDRRIKDLESILESERQAKKAELENAHNQEQEVKRLEKELAAAKKNHAKSTASWNQKRADNAEDAALADQRLKQAKDTAGDYKKQLTLLQSDLSQSRELVDSLRKSAFQKDKERTALQQQLDEEKREMKKFAEQTLSNTNSLSEELKNNETKLLLANEKYLRLEQDASSTKAECSQLRTELESKNVYIQNLKDAAEDSQKENGRLLAALTKKNEEVKTLAAARQKSDDRCKAAVQEGETKLKLVKENVLKLERDVTAAKQDVVITNLELTNTKNELVTAENELQKAKVDAQEAINNANLKEAKLLSHIQLLSDAQDARSKAEDAQSKTQVQLDEMSATYKTLQNRYAEQVKLNKFVTGERDDFKAKHEKLLKARKSSRDQILALQKEVTAIKEKLSAKNQEIAAKDSELTGLREAHASLSKASKLNGANEVNKVNKANEAKIAELDSKLALMTAKFTQMTTKHDAALKEKGSLNKITTDLTGELNQERSLRQERERTITQLEIEAKRREELANHESTAKLDQDKSLREEHERKIASLELENKRLDESLYRLANKCRPEGDETKNHPASWGNVVPVPGADLSELRAKLREMSDWLEAEEEHSAIQSALVDESRNNLRDHCERHHCIPVTERIHAQRVYFREHGKPMPTEEKPPPGKTLLDRMLERICPMPYSGVMEGPWILPEGERLSLGPEAGSEDQASGEGSPMQGVEQEDIEVDKLVARQIEQVYPAGYQLPPRPTEQPNSLGQPTVAGHITEHAMLSAQMQAEHAQQLNYYQVQHQQMHSAPMYNQAHHPAPTHTQALPSFMPPPPLPVQHARAASGHI